MLYINLPNLSWNKYKWSRNNIWKQIELKELNWYIKL